MHTINTGDWRHVSSWQLAIVFSLDAPLTLSHILTVFLLQPVACKLLLLSVSFTLSELY